LQLNALKTSSSYSAANFICVSFITKGLAGRGRAPALANFDKLRPCRPTLQDDLAALSVGVAAQAYDLSAATSLRREGAGDQALRLGDEDARRQEDRPQEHRRADACSP
jgi:hypothetical protein